MRWNKEMWVERTPLRSLDVYSLVRYTLRRLVNDSSLGSKAGGAPGDHGRIKCTHFTGVSDWLPASNNLSTPQVLTRVLQMYVHTQVTNCSHVLLGSYETKLCTVTSLYMNAVCRYIQYLPLNRENQVRTYHGKVLNSCIDILTDLTYYGIIIMIQST